MSWTAGIPVGTLNVHGCMPVEVLVVNDRDEHRTYIPEKTATRKVSSFGEVGRCNCSACNWCIDPYDLFCRRCGARLTETEYERSED